MALEVAAASVAASAEKTSDRVSRVASQRASSRGSSGVLRSTSSPQLLRSRPSFKALDDARTTLPEGTLTLNLNTPSPAQSRCGSAVGQSRQWTQPSEESSSSVATLRPLRPSSSQSRLSAIDFDCFSEAGGGSGTAEPSDSRKPLAAKVAFGTKSLRPATPLAKPAMLPPLEGPPVPPQQQPAVQAGGAVGSRDQWWMQQEDHGPTGTWWKGGLKIGAGSYGRVYKALNTTTGEVFVVKQAVSCRGDDPAHDKALLRELELVKGLRHPHIVSYLGHEFVDGHLCICLEFCSNGSLRSMVDEFGPLKGDLLQRATHGVLKGLNYLHTQNPLVVHRDLKGANVLMDQKFCSKLADFGCSKRCSNLAGSMSYSVVGSFPWMAPEVITAEKAQKRGAGRKADIWSLGCVVIEMATASNPWGSGAIKNGIQAYSIIGRSERTPPVPEELPELGRSFAALCIQRDAHQRPLTMDLMKHEWVQDWTD